MWRLVSLKSLVVLILLVLAITVLIISRNQSKIGQKLERAQALQRKDDDYYSAKEKEKIHDYPFEDELNAKINNNDNDFDPLSGPGISHKSNLNPQCAPSDSEIITCNINNGKYILGDCRKDSSTNEVYIPFDFLRKYFEVYGKLSTDTDPPTFNWLHCPPIKIYRLQSPYNPRQGLTYFENYNVEVRERVKCISGATGVPVSTQWDPKGYYYPIQIAQFGLSHYSKFMSTSVPDRTIIENGGTVRGDWENMDAISVVIDPENKLNIVIKITQGTHKLRLKTTRIQPHALLVSWSMKHEDLTTNSNSSIMINVTYENIRYELHYTTTGDYFIRAKNNQIFHGLGSKSSTTWHHIIRDLGVDLQKGIVFQQQQQETSKKKSKSKSPAVKVTRSKIILDSIQISNYNPSPASLLIDNLTVSLNEHLGQFYQAVDWFAENQDPRGGWPIPVSRKFHSAGSGGSLLTLNPGWYSAMAQGHGLSLLSRAYDLTKNHKYAQACTLAIESIFDQNGPNHGVRAMFLDKYPWFEEYPTSPPSFVLNGFMYSLIGLYDVVALRIPGAETKARTLYTAGLQSLITMLPLYDTGSGSMYDLRHFSLPGLSPNLARLDYHLTHINQLLIFSTISNHTVFKSTVERWIRYTEGQRAPHN